MPSAPMTSAGSRAVQEVRRQRRALRQRRAAAESPACPALGGARAEAETPSRRECEHMRASNALMIDPPVVCTDAPIVREGATGRLPAGYRPRRRATVGRLKLAFRILGPLEVMSPSGPIRLGGPRQRSVLAILLLDANRVVSIDRLADELYGEAPPVTAVTQMHRQISELRGLLEPDRAPGAAGAVIETRPPGYRILVAPDALDLAVLRAARGGSGLGARGRRRRDGRPALPGSARRLAGRAARRSRVRAVRAAGRRAPERAAPGGHGAVPRRRARARPRRRARPRARAARDASIR